jgi:hypothetical protein
MRFGGVALLLVDLALIPETEAVSAVSVELAQQIAGWGEER